MKIITWNVNSVRARLNNILTIKSIDFFDSDKNFIKIITNEYFYRKNHR